MIVDRHVIAIIHRMMQLMCVVRRVPHDLLWHTANIDTGSAERAVLDNRCTRSVLRRSLRMSKAATAATDNQQIKSF